jgi:hypothetical protein
MAGIELLGPYWQTLLRGRGFRLQVVTREPRTEAIARVEAAVQRQGGDVLDFTALSDLTLTMLVELDAPSVLALADGLRALGWPVELEPGRDALGARSAERLEGTVQLTFPEGRGELSHPQPAVPG